MARFLLMDVPNERNLKMIDDDVMSDEEFFEEVALGPKVTRPVARKRSKKAKKDIFAGIKVKMVMRIYGASHAKALEIIAARDAAETAADGESQIGGNRGDTNEELMSAEDFFGTCD